MIHGFKHDVQKSFNAGLQATKLANKLNDTVVIAPIFYVDEDTPNYKHCMNSNTLVGDSKKDLVWSCQGWMDGNPANNNKEISSFSVLDELISKLHTKWPSIQNITIVGFSAGGQTVQRYVGYAKVEKDIHVRYVISDPSSLLYFDSQRPTLKQNGNPASWQVCLNNDMNGYSFKMDIPNKQTCPNYNNWKYGIQIYQPI